MDYGKTHSKIHRDHNPAWKHVECSSLPIDNLCSIFISDDAHLMYFDWILPKNQIINSACQRNFLFHFYQMIIPFLLVH